MHSNVVHILRKDPLIELERAYLAKAFIYYLSVRHQKRDFVMTFFNSHAKVMQILKVEILPQERAEEAGSWIPHVACMFNLKSPCFV